MKVQYDGYSEKKKKKCPKLICMGGLKGKALPELTFLL